MINNIRMKAVQDFFEMMEMGLLEEVQEGEYKGEFRMTKKGLIWRDCLIKFAEMGSNIEKWRKTHSNKNAKMS